MPSQAPSDYTYVLTTVGLAALEREVIRMSKILDLDGSVAQASRIRQAYIKLLEELQGIAVTISDQARDDIVRARQQGNVRPDTGGAGGPRLDEFIGVSHPLLAVDGSVGVNNEAELDSGPAYWWRAIDLGYDWSGHADSDIRGYFIGANGGAFRPSAAMSGQHPIFRSTGATGPQMTPANDIAPQEFVDRGYQKTAGDWHALVQTAKRKFHREWEAALASSRPTGRRP